MLRFVVITGDKLYRKPFSNIFLRNRNFGFLVLNAWREHGTSRNVPEHEKITLIFMEINISNNKQCYKNL